MWCVATCLGLVSTSTLFIARIIGRRSLSGLIKRASSRSAGVGSCVVSTIHKITSAPSIASITASTITSSSVCNAFLINPGVSTKTIWCVSSVMMPSCRVRVVWRRGLTMAIFLLEQRVHQRALAGIGRADNRDKARIVGLRARIGRGCGQIRWSCCSVCFCGGLLQTLGCVVVGGETSASSWLGHRAAPGICCGWSPTPASVWPGRCCRRQETTGNAGVVVSIGDCNALADGSQPVADAAARTGGGQVERTADA